MCDADCSQDLHSGTVNTPSNATFGYRFAGRHILSAVIDDLKAKHDMANATDVMLAGDSAGGMGVWLNLRFVKQQFSASTTVVGAPIAVSAATSFCTGQVAATYFETHLVPQGFYFFVDPYRGPGATKSFLADFSKEAWPAHIELWGSEIDAACREANQNDLAVCMVANT